jgi:hypothetical protein
VRHFKTSRFQWQKFKRVIIDLLNYWRVPF